MRVCVPVPVLESLRYPEITSKHVLCVAASVFAPEFTLQRGQEAIPCTVASDMAPQSKHSVSYSSNKLYSGTGLYMNTMCLVINLRSLASSTVLSRMLQRTRRCTIFHCLQYWNTGQGDLMLYNVHQAGAEMDLEPTYQARMSLMAGESWLCS
jgi:hypothetical protein